MARAGLGLVPEGRQVFPNLTVRENLTATAARRSESMESWTLRSRPRPLSPRAARLSRASGLLSSGEQQMLAIGRALMTNPRLLILDEATERLAPLVCQVIWDALARLKARGQAILVIDKNLDPLTRIADRHHILEKGQVVWSASSAELRADAAIVHCILGL